ncbi:MAG: acetate--CoA ligase family protein [Nanoarchaeota archaeon]
MKIYNEFKAEQFLSKYLKISNSKLTKNINEALEFAKKSKYPIVLKIISDQLLHKSSINGVRIVNNQEELTINYNDLIKLVKIKKLKLDGILVKNYINGKEIIIGGKKDNTFGAIVLFGGGGIFTEILKDFSIRICPLNENDAKQMLEETKVYQTLKNVNVKQIINVILKINDIMLKHHEIIELDINPLIVNEKDAIVVDARMILE